MELRQENKSETLEQMSNEDLAQKCDKWVRSLTSSGGKDWTLEIPANFERDPDMLFSELIKRFKQFTSGQSMVEEENVPPGIIAFVNNSDTIVIQKGMDYKTWVRYHLNDLCSPASVIHSISVEGVVWEVGDKTNKGKLLELFYDKDLGWSAIVGDNNAFSFKNNKVYKLRNPPTERKIDGDFTKADIKLTGTENFKPEERKIVAWKVMQNLFVGTELDMDFKLSELPAIFTPIYSEPNPPVCELPDENGQMIALTKDDDAFFVDKTWHINNIPAEDYKDKSRCFATEAAANQFVKHNKPVYSESLIEDMCNASDISAVNRMYTEYCKKHNL